MKNHELLELIGDVNEDYVQAADSKVIRPRFGWKKLAVCAACGLLVLGIYPAYRMSRTQNLHLFGLRPLHGYTVVEGSGMVGPESAQAPAGGQTDIPGQNAPEPTPEPAQTGDGEHYDVSGQWQAIAQYQGLLQGMGGQEGCAPETYPGWYGGAWIDGTGDRLAVAIVDGFHTGQLEAQIEEWCGGEVAFVQDMKYSYAHLLNLSDQILQALQDHLNQDDVWSALTSIAPDMMANRLNVGFCDIPSDAVLAFLAQLDPDGDAIQVQVFTGKPNTLDNMVKAPAREPADPEARATPTDGDAPDAYAPAPGGVTPATTADGSAKVYHGEDAPADAVPGGAYAGEPPQAEETSQPAHYDLLPPGE